MMNCLRAAVIAAVLLGLAAVAGALGPERPLTAEELGSLTGTDWYSVEILGQRSGYACVQVEVVDTPDGPGLKVTEDVKILVSLGGQQREVSKSQVTRYDARLRLMSVEMAKDEMGRTQTISAELDGDQLTIIKSVAGSAVADDVRIITVSDEFHSDIVIPWHLSRGELGVGDELTFEMYDSEVDAIDRHRVLVERRETTEDGVEATVIRVISEKLGIKAVSRLDARGTMLRQEIEGLMGLTLVRVPEEEALAELTAFEVTGTVAVEGHLPAVRQLEEVRLRVRRRAGEAVDLIPGSRRQEVVADGDDALVTITRERPPLTVATLPIEDPELAECLASTTHAQADDPAIVAKAREIVGEETDAWAAAQKIVSWVHRNMRKVSSEPRPISAVECLDEMVGDCTEHAVLAAALGRAVGLPTRMCTGLAYIGGGFGYHAWSEFYVGRWVEMDPSWGEMTADAGHMRLHSSTLDEMSYARASLATGRTLGSIEIDLLGYRDAAGDEVDLTEE